MEIEVGEYVRLDNGKIGKVIAVEKGSIMLDLRSNRWVGLCCIKKHSKNIIDLIEARDFVNGERVTNIMDNGVGTEMGRFIAKEHIDTILTHEMYEQNCYKVGDIDE